MTEETEKQMLDELRKQTLLLARQTKDNRIGIFTVLILLVVAVATIPFLDPIISRLRPARHVIDSWEQARTLHSEGKWADAEKMVQRLITKYPNYDYGYTLLAYCEQQMGNLAEAETNYTKAYDLFPSEQNEKDLAAIRKAIERKKGPAKTSSPDQYQRMLDEQESRSRRAEALLARQEEVFKVQEKHIEQYGKIVDGWEKQQQQYQKYLDSLGKNGQPNN